MKEFDLIRSFFLPLAEGRAEAGDFVNDGAVLSVPDGKELVVSSDTLNADIHFFADQPAATIAKKALRSNLSDILSMGARPYCYQLCLALPEVDEQWLRDFTAGLAEDQKLYNLFCCGGDTTSIRGHVSISITMFGLVNKGASLSRAKARAGDAILLSGSVGDAYCGLQGLREVISDVPEFCRARYFVPEPPVAILPLFEQQNAHIHAAMDISDGLLADLGHMAAASNLRAVISLGDIRYSAAVEQLLACNSVSPHELLSGGDDYQLLLSVAADQAETIIKLAHEKNIQLQKVGNFEAGAAGVQVMDENGSPVTFNQAGWQHF